uniref:poly(ADP-ribose) glycohydrolase n=1 Tax=Triatoma infestans TaxID=30076 RepID=A0A023EX02_TRIIF
MALVMLPCDLPWWPTIVHHLTQISTATNAGDLIESMQRIHNLCNVGLDPDEAETSDVDVFNGFHQFLDELNDEEKFSFFNHTLPCIAQRAIDLKRLRPPNGLHFSLQQQGDRVEYNRDFVASLLAHGFFSTFPKRTLKTHPTLQDFNFTNFFRYLHLEHQKCKFRSLLHYFNYMGRCTPQKKIFLSRKVMHSSHWLTLDDWEQCKLPLCPLLIRRQGDIYSIGSDHVIVCSTTNRIGGDVLADGMSMECIQLITCPEMLVILLCVEALEDNEVLIAEGVLQVTKISGVKAGNVMLEKIMSPQLLTVCCMDPEDYSEFPVLQYQQDCILRELNKALVGFRQKSNSNGILPRRLSPIGESFSSTPEKDTSIKKTESRQVQQHQQQQPLQQQMELPQRTKFIVLGSSGECLPVTRHQSRYSSCHSASSTDQEFHSARTSFTEEEVDDGSSKQYSCQLDKEDRRSIFAERLREALDRAEAATAETEETDIRYGRDGSCGFVLEEECAGSTDPNVFRERLNQYRSASSKYSFTTDYSSELEIVYEQLGRWLEEDGTIPIDVDTKAIRERAVIQFAGNLLKRTLSESFVGISVTDGIQEEIPAKNIKIAARSLSLELARHKNKLAAQLVSVVLNRNEDLMPLATYNWGCSSRKGDPQLKLFIQWLAASVALLPHIVYFTAANSQLNKLDTVCRVLLDRQWSVGDLISALLRYSDIKIVNPHENISPSLFEQIIGMEERTPYDKSDNSTPE